MSPQFEVDNERREKTSEDEFDHDLSSAFSSPLSFFLHDASNIDDFIQSPKVKRWLQQMGAYLRP